MEPDQVDVKDDKGCTPCLMAALNGHLETVEHLVDKFKSKVDKTSRLSGCVFPCVMLFWNLLLLARGVVHIVYYMHVYFHLDFG